ncbi:MAG: lipoate--protein ligase [Candidatus Bathyarchaeia archaeon]
MRDEWRLIDLGRLEPLRAQALYEAVAVTVGRGLSPNTLILCSPAEPYVCIGYHQVLERELDVDLCRKHRLPIIRRAQGGGAVYLDCNQQFYQVVAKRDDPSIPSRVEKLFETFLKPTVYACRRLGLEAEYKPLNDVVVNGRKVSGNGAGVLDGAVVLVGNIILDLDYKMMSQVLRVPSEKFRDKLAKSMGEWVTSLKRELGKAPPAEDVKRYLVEGYERIGIRLRIGQLSDVEEEIFTSETKPRHLSPEWLYQPILHRLGSDLRVVRVAGAREVRETIYKARKLIRVTAEIVDGRIVDVVISGDFFIVPEDTIRKLEKIMVGSTLDVTDVERRVKQFYEGSNAQFPGIEPQDLVEAFMQLKPRK